ncbi:hypothetical protein E0Z10_g4397 [Xylaria hypoxylon]|uniref:Uncharacterized protein n=1 Tax=Xylaria hypoxylon TaxID=37992 RepID=A0A4Z0YJ75_9PEZI|nr:hypothetical protein E0Z10_g4397 [Xylaria hypoxylon]
MRTLYSGFVLLALSALSPVQADSYKVYDQPVKRNLLQDLLDRLNRGNGGKGQDGVAQTVTETVRQTITVGGGGAVGGAFNTSAPTATATSTITVTQVAEGVTEQVTVTQLATTTTTMMQLIACGTDFGIPIPAAEASSIATSVAAVVSSGLAELSSIAATSSIPAIETSEAFYT